VQGPAASTIFFTIQGHRNSGFKGFIAHCIATGPAIYLDDSPVASFLDFISGCPGPLIDFWFRGRKLISALPIITNKNDFIPGPYLQVPAGFVANRPEINAIQLGIFPDSLAAVVSAITAAVLVGLKQCLPAFAPEGYRPVTVSGAGS